MTPEIIPHLLESCCQSVPDKICLKEKDQTLTFSQLRMRAMGIAGALLQMGVTSGDHIGVVMDKSMDQVVALMGVYYAGAVLVLINPILSSEQIIYILNDCEIKTVVGTNLRLKKLEQVFSACKVERILIFDADGDNSYGAVRAFDGNYESLPVIETLPSGISDDTAHIIYTSGSTGMPKGIVISHRNVIEGAGIVSQYTGLRKDDRMMGTLPFNFDYGFNQFFNMLHMQATLVLHRFFMPNDLLKVLDKEKITVFAGMTPIWAKLFNPKLTKVTSEYDLSHIRVITNTGGKVPVTIVRKLEALFTNAQIYLMYGLTEAFRSTYLHPDEIQQRPESIGKAVPNVDVMVINDDGRECEPDEEGELIHRGALISKGYWNNPEKTAEVFRPNPLLSNTNLHLETVVYSGDIVRRDEQGYLYYVGRKDHMIKTKGYRVSPSEVEELLSQIDGINQCVAVGYEGEDDNCLRVFVQMTGGDLTPVKILKYCRANGPFYLVPDDVVVLEQFPLTPNGKIDRNKILMEYKAHE
ncbi:AMP-binding protein [bacterium]|nr:AMP-binding protein [bacterium]